MEKKNQIKNIIIIDPEREYKFMCHKLGIYKKDNKEKANEKEKSDE